MNRITVPDAVRWIMRQEAKFSQLTPDEKTEYMSLVNRFMALNERAERSGQKATSIVRMFLSGGTHRIQQGIREIFIRRAYDELEKEIDAFFDRIDEKYGTYTPHPRRSFPGYDDMYLRNLIAGSVKPYHFW